MFPREQTPDKPRPALALLARIRAAARGFRGGPAPQPEPPEPPNCPEWPPRIGIRPPRIQGTRVTFWNGSVQDFPGADFAGRCGDHLVIFISGRIHDLVPIRGIYHYSFF